MFDLHNFKIQLLNSRGERKKTQMSRVYQNLVWNDAYKHLEIYTYYYIMFLSFICVNVMFKQSKLQYFIISLRLR